MEGSCVVLVHFVEIMTSKPFRKNFLLPELKVCNFLEWLITLDAPAAKSICELMKKVDTRTEP